MTKHCTPHTLRNFTTMAKARYIKSTIREDTLFEGEFYGPESVQDIVALPSKSILLSQLLGELRAPIQGLMSGLHGLLCKVVIALNEIKKEKEKSGK